MGMIIPEKKSPMAVAITMLPTGIMVINIDIYISIDMETSTISPRNKEAMNSKNVVTLSGNTIL